jgi:hypothetical protein
MTAAKEEAKELVSEFLNIEDSKIEFSKGSVLLILIEAKQCALICVDEKIKTYLKNYTYQEELALNTQEYYDLKEVKQEINKI